MANIKQKEKCSYADRYKAKRKPSCGCKTCQDKWEKAQLKRRIFVLENAVKILQREEQQRREERLERLERPDCDPGCLY